MRLKRSIIFSVLLAGFVLQYSLFVFHSFFWDRAIKLSMLAGMLFLFQHRRLDRAYARTALIYLLLLVSALLASMISFDFDGILQWIKVSLAFAALILPLTYLRQGEAAPHPLLTWPLWAGLFFSLQSFGLYFIIRFGIPVDSEYISLEKLGFAPELSYGIWGFANAITSTSTGDFVLRAQSWFLEPSKLAGFLIYPALLAGALAYIRRSLFYFLIGLTCLAGIAITFSLAGFFGLASSVLALVLIRPTRRNAPGRGLLSYARPMFVGIAAFFLFTQALTYTHSLFISGAEDSAITKALARNPGTQSMIREASKVPETIMLLNSKPFGIGLGNTLGFNEATSPNAFIYWTVAGGIPAVIAIFLLYWNLVFTYCIPCLESTDVTHRAIAAAFVGHTIQQLSYGTWSEPAYLFNVAAMMMCAPSRVRAAPRLVPTPQTTAA